MREDLRASRITAVGWRSVALALFVATTCFAAATAPQGAEPVACVPARSDDPEPWTWNSRILESFRPDNPKPKFVGAFGDGRSQYEFSLWRDSKGVFGELRSPVLEADSPTSRLYDPHFDPETGTLDFTVRFYDGERRFSGILRSGSVKGTLQHAGRGEPVTWQRLRVDRERGANFDFYTSRAKFECAMILFRRQ
jgi:hypothetical protein